MEEAPKEALLGEEGGGEGRGGGGGGGGGGGRPGAPVWLGGLSVPGAAAACSLWLGRVGASSAATKSDRTAEGTSDGGTAM